MSLLVAYTRISSETQQENTSLENQYRRIQAYCELTGHRILCHFEETATGADINKRPVFKEALNVVFNGAADGIICMRLDRFARSTYDGLDVLRQLDNAGKQLVVLDLNLDTSTGIGRCMMTVLLAFAQLERDTIHERTQTGQKAVWEAGGYAFGRPPYGWDVDRVAKKLVINPTEQKVRALIFRWHYAEGMGPTAIARELNRHGIPAKSGGLWQMDVVRKMLSRGDNYINAHVMEFREDERAS